MPQGLTGLVRSLAVTLPLIHAVRESAVVWQVTHSSRLLLGFLFWPRVAGVDFNLRANTLSQGKCAARSVLTALGYSLRLGTAAVSDLRLPHWQ